MDKFNEMDVVELKPSKKIETNGGGPILTGIVAGVAAGMVISGVNNWSDIKSGAKDAYEDMSQAMKL